MFIQILECENYSKSACRIYQETGSVISGDCQDSKKSVIEILVCRLAYKLDADFLSQYPALKIIASPTTATDHIDASYCENNRIEIFSLKSCMKDIQNISSTSEHTLGLLLSLLRNIPSAHQHVLNQNWHRDRFKSRQLSDMTLGIIGLGRIGTQLARYANAFNMNIIACDPYIDDFKFKSAGVTKTDLGELCRKADIVSIHANLNDEEQLLLGKQQISYMKPEALIINTARGVLLDEQAAALALEQNKLGGIAVDVLQNENSANFPACSPLYQAARKGLNVILTPHIGGCTTDAMHYTEKLIARQVADYVLNQEQRCSAC